MMAWQWMLRSTALEIQVELEKEDSQRINTAPKYRVQVFKLGDRVWVERPHPLGTQRTKTWYGTSPQRWWTRWVRIPTR